MDPFASHEQKARIPQVKRTRRVSRSLSILLASMFLLVAFAAPVAAAQTPIEERRVREDVPLGDFDVVIEPEVGCGDFAVEVNDIAGQITYVFITEDRHGNILERAIWHTTTRYTIVETGATFERRFDSVANYLLRADGSSKYIFRNDILTWYAPSDPAELGPGVWLIDHGRLIEEYNADGNLVASDYQGGEVTDVCAALS